MFRDVQYRLFDGFFLYLYEISTRDFTAYKKMKYLDDDISLKYFFKVFFR